MSLAEGLAVMGYLPAESETEMHPRTKIPPKEEVPVENVRFGLEDYCRARLFRRNFSSGESCFGSRHYGSCTGFVAHSINAPT